MNATMRMFRYGLGAALLLVLATGCGFHLRSYDFQGNVDSYALAGKTRIQVAGPLRQMLRQAGVAEVGAGDAALIVELLDQRNERRSISTGSSARAAEYETTYAVQYRILRGGEVMAPSTWVERRRVYSIDRGNIVGSSEEQALLEREMMQDVAGQIVRAMDAVSRNLSEQSVNAG